jgi:hypothetical protein
MNPMEINAIGRKLAHVVTEHVGSTIALIDVETATLIVLHFETE